MRLAPAIMMLFCIELINARDTIPDIILKGHQYTVYCIDISKDNKYLVSGGWDNSVKLWDYKNAKEIKSFDYHKDMIRCLKFSNDNSMIASVSEDNSVRIWDVKTAQQIWKYESDSFFLSCAISPDAKYLAASSRDETIKIWDLNRILN